MLIRAMFTMFALSAPVFAECWYTYTEIPNPPGWFCQGRAINARGEVAGYALSGGDNARAFVWSPMNGTRLLPYPPGFDDMRAYDINDHGHVVGYAVTPTGTWRGFIWRDEQYEFIEPAPWANATEAYAINNANQVVGETRVAAHEPIHAFLWDLGVTTDLGPILDSGPSRGRGINNAGQVAGFAYAANPHVTHAFAGFANKIAVLLELDIMRSSRAAAINDKGVVVGSALVSVELPSGGARTRGAVWIDGTVQIVDLPGAMNSAIRLTAINSQNRAVGYSAAELDTAIVWQNGSVLDLADRVIPTPPVWLGIGFDINDAGHIVAHSNTGTVVLTPIRRIGDLTGDCEVTIDDLVLLLCEFGTADFDHAAADLDADRDVDIHDLAVLLSHWTG